MRLQERDFQIILTNFKYRYLTFDQIQKLFFPSTQTTKRRIEKLMSYGYIKREKIGERQIFFLDKIGLNLISDHYGISIRKLHYRSVPPNYLFLNHLIEINDFRIKLNLAARNSQIKIEKFIPEYWQKQVFDEYSKTTKLKIGNRKVHYTDAVIVLNKNGNLALFFLEIDRGTEILNSLRTGFLKMINFYLEYMLSSNFIKQFHGYNVFRVLIVTTSINRLENMIQASKKLDYDDAYLNYIWLTTKDQEFSFKKPIWKSLNCREKNYAIDQ